MQPARPAQVLLRAVFALVFGFMSLGHWPVMAFAKASAEAQGRTMTHGVVHARAAHAHHAAADAPDCEMGHMADTGAHHHGGPAKVGICNATGCFLVIAPPAIVAPPSDSSLLAQLHPAPMRAMAATLPDPADPPPRLQV